MKYEMSWTQKDGTRVSGQVFTAENISSMLEQLEEWEATNIVIRSNASESVDKFDIVLSMIDARLTDAKRVIERSKEEIESELKHDFTHVDIECYATRIRVAQEQVRVLEEERKHVEFLRDFNN